MQASLFKRLTSSFVDLCLIILVVYGVFFLWGQGWLQGRIDNFDILYADYNEIIERYNKDLSYIQTEYNVAVELADGDEALEDIAYEEYQQQVAVLDLQNTIDINPYNLPLTQYFSEIIYFFVFGFIVFATILTIAVTGRTPGRKIMGIKTAYEKEAGEFTDINPFQAFFHDIVFKYFLIVLVFAINMYFGVMLMLVGFIIDIFMISFTRNRTTIRDLVTKVRVIKV